MAKMDSLSDLSGGWFRSRSSTFHNRIRPSSVLERSKTTERRTIRIFLRFFMSGGFADDHNIRVSCSLNLSIMHDDGTSYTVSLFAISSFRIAWMRTWEASRALHYTTLHHTTLHCYVVLSFPKDFSSASRFALLTFSNLFHPISAQ